MTRLLVAILVSVAGHALVFAMWPAARPQFGNAIGPTLQARLLSQPNYSQQGPRSQADPHEPEPPPTKSSSAPAQNETATKAAEHARRTTTAATRGETDPASNSATLTRPTAAAATSAHAAQPAPFNDNELRAELLAAVHGELAHHFFYPQLARRKGWQGRVDLGFRVEADGRIERIRVVRSSGHGILDRSAIQALRDVGRLSVTAPRRGGRGWDLDLPVIYRLHEG